MTTKIGCKYDIPALGQMTWREKEPTPPKKLDLSNRTLAKKKVDSSFRLLKES